MALESVIILGVLSMVQMCIFEKTKANSASVAKVWIFVLSLCVNIHMGIP